MNTKFIKYIIGFIFLTPLLQISAQNTIDSNRIIKVLTFNIYHGETMNHDFDLDKIAEVIINADPDLVALQEVDFKTNRVSKIDLATQLACKTKLIPIFGKAMDFDDGEYGNAILSKYSFLKTQKHDLPYMDGYEPRVAIEATIVLPTGDTISFVSTHLDYKKENIVRIRQTRVLNNILLKSKYPVILAGDLNDTPGSDVINLLETDLTSSYIKKHPTPTFPSNNPSKKIDYVMFNPNSKFRVIERKVINNNIASDHCAYLVTLELIDYP